MRPIDTEPKKRASRRLSGRLLIPSQRKAHRRSAEKRTDEWRRLLILLCRARVKKSLTAIGRRGLLNASRGERWGRASHNCSYNCGQAHTTEAQLKHNRRRRTVAEYTRLQRAATARYKAHLTSGAVLHIAEGGTGLKRGRGAYRGKEGASTRKQSIGQFIIMQFILIFPPISAKKANAPGVSTEIKCALSQFFSIRSLRFINFPAALYTK